MALIDKIDNRLSFLVRQIGARRNSGESEAKIVQCYTCDAIYPITRIQCGHFIPRGNNCTRFLIDNCRPQCVNCNQFLHGNLKVFEERLEKEIPGIVARLRELGNKVCDYSESDLEEIEQNIKIETIKHVRRS